jgi:hypothetical protein
MVKYYRIFFGNASESRHGSEKHEATPHQRPSRMACQSRLTAQMDVFSKGQGVIMSSVDKFLQ